MASQAVMARAALPMATAGHTGAAALLLPSPGWFAVMTHEPAAVMVSIVPETEHGAPLGTL
jgi:hypothetical protein